MSAMLPFLHGLHAACILPMHAWLDLSPTWLSVWHAWACSCMHSTLTSHAHALPLEQPDSLPAPRMHVLAMMTHPPSHTCTCACMQAAVAVHGERTLWAPKPSSSKGAQQAAATAGSAAGSAGGSGGGSTAAPSLGPHNPIRQGIS